MPSLNLPNQSGLMNKRIPTILGVLILVAGLVAGTIIFSQGTGVFAPRATPETTPAQVRITNITDRTFTISFLTAQATTGYVKYGTEPNKLNIQVSDDRDQIRGTVDERQLHHISVRDLDAGKTYYYVLGTGSGSEFDNNGQPFSISTAKRGGVAPPAKTIHGNVITAGGTPAQGAIVYAKIEGAGEMSSLVKDSGTWAIPLSNARKVDGSGYAEVSDASNLMLTIQGTTAGLKSEISTTVGGFELGSNITLGGDNSELASSQSSSKSQESEETSTDTADSTETQTENSESDTETTQEERKTGGLSGLLGEDSETATPEAETASPTAVLVDLTKAQHQEVDTTQPIISGKVAPNTKVTIKVNSDTQIEQDVVTDANGNFELDIAALSEQLEPGEHTVEYSYVDPDTGELVTEVITFTVPDRAVPRTDDTSSQIAQAATTPTPTTRPATGTTGTPTPTPVSYGTQNPYGSTSPTPSASSSATATDSGSTKGGVSTRSAVPSTSSGVPVSGSVSTTLALILGGLFFIIAGVWSYWIATELQKMEA